MGRSPGRPLCRRRLSRRQKELAAGGGAGGRAGGRWSRWRSVAALASPPSSEPDRGHGAAPRREPPPPRASLAPLLSPLFGASPPSSPLRATALCDCGRGATRPKQQIAHPSRAPLLCSSHLCSPRPPLEEAPGSSTRRGPEKSTGSLAHAPLGALARAGTHAPLGARIAVSHERARAIARFL